MYAMEELVRERTRDRLERAEKLQHSRRLRTLRRARRMERKAERKMFEAWSRAAELRSGLESLHY